MLLQPFAQKQSFQTLVVCCSSCLHKSKAFKHLLCAAQVPAQHIVDSYKVERGRVAGLQEEAGKFAGMVAAFCECMGYSDLEMLISKFQVST